ncbi:NUDIX hydrolase [Alicyclobacillus shizuokensis]|uniref:NUDIX hydrolase n=1 Tax=Alicyclobacillus shizuokensis TaxID=392014 RepID=UPI0008323649|nr:NUDIX domain-containing protein [Alicyclobacillus shizuokensis]
MLRNDFVATGLIINDSGNKILLVFHKKLKKWLPPGGHLESNELPHEAAIREIYEETKLMPTLIEQPPRIFNTNERELPLPYMILHEYIPIHGTEEAHTHVDFIYIFRSSEGSVSLQTSEIVDAKWFELDEVMACDTHVILM